MQKEFLLLSRIQEETETRNLLPRKQFEFQGRYSAEQQLITNIAVQGIIMDIKRAFDRTWQDDTSQLPCLDVQTHQKLLARTRDEIKDRLTSNWRKKIGSRCSGGWGCRPALVQYVYARQSQNIRHKSSNVCRWHSMIAIFRRKKYLTRKLGQDIRVWLVS